MRPALYTQTRAPGTHPWPRKLPLFPPTFLPYFFAGEERVEISPLLSSLHSYLAEAVGLEQVLDLDVNGPPQRVVIVDLRQRALDTIEHRHGSYTGPQDGGVFLERPKAFCNGRGIRNSYG